MQEGFHHGCLSFLLLTNTVAGKHAQSFDRFHSGDVVLMMLSSDLSIVNRDV